MKKTFFSIAYAAIITLGTITISSCEKENTEIANGINKETFTDKSANANSIYQEAKQATISICEKIDAAFALDSVSFKTVCEAEDINGFMNLTGITEGELNNYNTLINSVYDTYISENLEFESELGDGTCTECTSNPLKKLYNATSKTQSTGGVRGIASGIGDYEIAAAGTECFKICNAIPYLPVRALCIAGCLLFRFL
ncbi:MAG: hypothetical protein IKD33_00570 [Bacteroidales bacterium]|nr:hypothetical protein [Bacteroidales bacterium]